MREKDYLKSVWLELKAMNLSHVPHYEDTTFARFAIRHGFSPISPQRQARIDALLDQYAERARLAELPDARIYLFPSEPVAAVFDLASERLRRQRDSG